MKPVRPAWSGPARPRFSPTVIPEIHPICDSGATVYSVHAMNENSSSNPSISASQHGLTAEAISRRAYELWEQEGRPENRDLHHWLRAEQELLAEQGKSSSKSGNSRAETAENSDWLKPEKDLLQQNRSGGAARAQNTDQPMQAARAITGGRDTKSSGKRGSAAPFEKPGRAMPPSTRGPAGRA